MNKNDAQVYNTLLKLPGLQPKRRKAQYIHIMLSICTKPLPLL